MSTTETNLQYLDNSQVRISIDATEDDVNHAYASAIKVLTQKVKWKGFRPGKVPAYIIERNFAESLKHDALEELISKSLNDCIKKNNLHTVGTPEILDIDKIIPAFEKNKPIHFEAMVEEFPSVDIKQYKNLSVKVPEYYHNESHVEKHLQQLQQKQSRVDRKSEDAVVNDKSILQIQYAFYLVSHDASKNFIYNIDLNHPDPWFSSIQHKLIGMKRGDEAHFDIDIPQNYSDKNLQGRKGRVWIKILTLSELILPNLDDDFAKDLYYEDLAALKKDINSMYVELAKKKQKEFAWNALFQKIKENAEFKIGPKFIEEEFKYQAKNFKNNLEKASLSFEDYLKQTQDTLESWEAKLKERITQDIKYYLIRNAIIQKEKVQIVESDVQAELARYAKQYKMSVDEFKNKISKTPEQLEQIRQNCIDEKIYERLSQLNQIQEGDKELLSTD